MDIQQSAEDAHRSYLPPNFSKHGGSLRALHFMAFNVNQCESDRGFPAKFRLAILYLTKYSCNRSTVFAPVKGDPNSYCKNNQQNLAKL